MKKITKQFSLQEAQWLALKSQGLLKPDWGKGKKGALAAIELLGYVQIDTLSVVARAHHHILWSRLPDYNENFLNELLEKDKAIFEYWSHAASYLPMSEYRFSLPQKKSYAGGKSHWFGQDKKMNKYVLDRIKAEGPLQSKDFEYKRDGPGNWYEWKPAKRALEQLFMEGKLMVAKRQGFHKVYDLTVNVLPANVNASFPTEKEYTKHLIRKAIQAHGLVSENEITYLRKGLKAPVNIALKSMLMDGELMEVKIEGLEKPSFINHVNPLLKSDSNNEKIKLINSIHFLSPFDNLVIQRKRLQTLFDFGYMVECYLPEAKRKYGYFSLPVLYGDKFIARFDPKADRATKIFHIKNIQFENGFKPDETFNALFTSKLMAFAAFNACTKIVIDKADKNWKREINSVYKKMAM